MCICSSLFGKLKVRGWWWSQLDDECCRHGDTGQLFRRTRDARHGTRGWPGGWILSTPLHTRTSCWPLIQWVSACHWSVVIIPGLPLVVKQWSAETTRTSVRHEAMGQRAEDQTLKSITFMKLMHVLCWVTFEIFLLQLCNMFNTPFNVQGAGTGDTGRGQRERPGWNCWASLAWAHSGLRSSLSLGTESVSPHSLNPLSVAQKLSPANGDY